ncbi:MAG TPA: hypothetical protein VH583_05735 [Vicinamibacterales bacterium]|jgi:HEAT repeat protein
MGYSRRTVLAVVALTSAAGIVISAQVGFDQAIADLSSPDAAVRLKTAQHLRTAAYPEAAVPLTPLLADKQDAVQLEAIGAELNIFLEDSIPSRKGVDIEVTKRSKTSAEKAFADGPLALSYRTVPNEVLAALRTAAHDDNPRVSVEALYAFGALAVEPTGLARRALLKESAPELTAMLGAREESQRRAAVRVIARVFEKRPGDEPVDEELGDAMIRTLNDKDRLVKLGAMDALGAMKYERSEQALTELFKFYGKGEFAEATLNALARLEAPSTAGLLTDQLTSKQAACRGIAVEGLTRLPGIAKLKTMEDTLAKEREESVQLALAFAATKLEGAPLDKIGEAVVTSRMHDQAKGYLMEIAPGHAQLLERLVQDPDSRMRFEVAEVLMLAGDSSALPQATRLASDSDPIVARAGTRAVARLRTRAQ